MKKKELIKRIKQKAAKDRGLRKDLRYLNVMGFLKGRGLLFTNQNIMAQPKKRIDLKDYIWVGEKVEPRVLELLPAVMLRFPKYVENPQDAPEELAKVVFMLNAFKEKGPDFMGMPYKKMREWAYLSLQDRRTKSLGEKKILKSFRLSPATLSKIFKVAKLNNVSNTEVIEVSVSQLKSI